MAGQQMRDTARDIIQGTDPPGMSKAAAPPADSVAFPSGSSRKRPGPTLIRSMSGEELANQRRAYAQLQTQLEILRRQQDELAAVSEQTRRRLEAAQQLLHRRLETTEGAAVSVRELAELRRLVAAFDSRVSGLGSELLGVRAAMERQAGELRVLGSDLRSRPTVDPARIATATQAIESRLRELQVQMVQLKQNLDAEMAERTRANATQADIIGKLQELVRNQDVGKAEQLTVMGRRLEVDRERMGEEMRRLTERVQLMAQDWARAQAEREGRLREELAQRQSAIQASVNTQLDRRTELERDMLRRSEERWRGQQKLVEELRLLVQAERQKYKERFQRVNEALQTLEAHLETGHQKMDRLVGAELESRKLHERALLTKLQDVEGRLNNHVNQLTKTMEEVRSGLGQIRIPVLDTDALRRDMEAIAADRNKLSMEGLLRLEERITRMRHVLQKERRELHSGLEEAVDREVNAKLKVQLEKLDDLVGEVERTQTAIRDRVEHQIPADLEEMEAKLENVKAQLVRRIDQEEEERYLAVKELQDAYGRLAAGGRMAGSMGVPGMGGAMEPVSSASLKRDLDECKVAIKKLAESLTTVKNVLDRKLMEEVRRREQDVEILNTRIDTATVQALQIQ